MLSLQAQPTAMTTGGSAGAGWGDLLVPQPASGAPLLQPQPASQPPKGTTPEKVCCALQQTVIVIHVTLSTYNIPFTKILTWRVN